MSTISSSLTAERTGEGGKNCQQLVLKGWEILKHLRKSIERKRERDWWPDGGGSAVALMENPAVSSLMKMKLILLLASRSLYFLLSCCHFLVFILGSSCWLTMVAVPAQWTAILLLHFSHCTVFEQNSLTLFLFFLGCLLEKKKATQNP